MNFKVILRYILLGGLFATLFLPFLVANSELFPFISGKGFAFRILVELLLGLWIVGMFWDASLRPKFSWIMGTILVFVGVITVADIFGVSFYQSFWSNFERMEGLITSLHLLAYFLVAGSVVNTRARWQAFFNISIITSVVMSIYAFLQLAGKITINQGGVRVDGTFGNTTYLAVYMLFNFFITLLLLVRAYQDRTKTAWYLVSWYGLALVCQIVVMYYTETRGVILGFLGGILVSAILVALFEKNRPKLRKISAGILLGIAVLVGGFFLVRNTEFVTKSQTLNRFASLSIQELNTQGRRFIWPMAWQGFKDHPILGWGQENFIYVFDKYYDPRMYAQEPWFDHAHNIVLDWLVAGGILGLAGYLSMFVALFLLLWKNESFSVTEKSIIVGLLAAYFFQNLFVFDNLISSLYFFSFLAFVHSERVKGESESVWLTKISENSLISKKILPVLAVIAVVILVYGLNIRPILAGRDIINALNSPTADQNLNYFKEALGYQTFANGEVTEQLTTQVQRFSAKDVSSETKQAFAKLTIASLDAEIGKFPNNTRSLFLMGGFRNRINDFNGAISYLERAEKTSPKKQSILFEFGFSYVSAGDNQKGLEKFKQAYDLAPDYPEAKTLYALALLYNKQDVLAKKLIDEVTQGGRILDERIVETYVETGHIQDAIKILEKQVELHPQDPKLRFRLAAGYLSLGQRSKAVEILNQIGKLFPDQKAQADYYAKEIQAGRNP